MKNTIMIFLFASLCIGCTAEEITCLDTSEALRDLANNRALWESHAITNYSMTYRDSNTSCTGGDPLAPVVITVSNNVVTSVYHPSTGSYGVVSDSDPTIDEVFDKIETQLTDSCITEYLGIFDEQYGFPAWFSMVIDNCDTDIEGISDFQ